MNLENIWGEDLAMFVDILNIEDEKKKVEVKIFWFEELGK